MASNYDVFLCHRGPDTKRNLVSVLSGMLSSMGMTSFVDFEMREGTDVNFAIREAIESSKVHIVIVSPGFEKSKWCLNEAVQIMQIQSSAGTSDRPGRVIPVFCDLESSEVRQRAEEAGYDVKGSLAEDRKQWGKSLEGLCHLEDRFTYDSKKESLWKIVVKIAEELHKVVYSHRSPRNERYVHQRRWPDQDYDVFVCRWGPDTEHNVVSVFRGMLQSKGITCLEINDMNSETEMKSHTEEAIQKSKVYVIFLSPKFVSSRRCLEEVRQIMSIVTSNTTRRVLPVFYDVEPYEVRHQTGTFTLCNVSPEGNGWSESLRNLSLIKGFEMKPAHMFLWSELEKIVTEVSTSLKEPTRGKAYAEQIEAVQRVLKSKKADNVFLVGIYGPDTSQFVKLLARNISGQFHASCKLRNLMEKGSTEHVIAQLYSHLIRNSNAELSENDVFARGSSYEQLLHKRKCLVILDIIGNDIYQTRELLKHLKRTLSKSSVVFVTSEYKHMLEEVVKVDELIELPSLQDTKGTLILCYHNRDDVNVAFLNHLQETFCMYGLDVRLLSIENVLMNNSENVGNEKVILCIVSKGFSIGGCEKMFRNAKVHCPNIVYILYGPHATNESTSELPCFKISVNFEESGLEKAAFKRMVNKVVNNFNQGHVKATQVIDFPVGLVQRVDMMKSRIRSHLRESDTSVLCFGIVGMGGAGKTVTARSIFNGMSTEFEKLCFCSKIRANVEGKPSGLVDIQRRILLDILGTDYENFINGEEHGQLLLESKLEGINALIVLDDVDTAKQLRCLYDPLCSSLGPKSVIIITSRDQNVLKIAQPKQTFQIRGLDNREDSERLFYWHAFLRPEPPVDLIDDSRRVIDACGRLPLLLKVFGAHLYQHNAKHNWDEVLDVMKRKEKIFRKLGISLKRLESSEKEAFLDICCFLVGEEEETVCRILEGCYEGGRTCLDVLISRCLITIDIEYSWVKGRIMGEKRIVGVHDFLRDMGGYIIRNEVRNRAWDEETANDILKDERAPCTLRGLSITSDFRFPEMARNWKSLPSLKLLEVKQVDGDAKNREGFFAENLFDKVHCDDLRWLKWRRAPLKNLPVGLCSRSLRLLDVESSAEISGPSASLPKLERLNLSGCDSIVDLPEEMGRFSSLQQLDLNDCGSLKTLYFLPTSLVELNLKRCIDLESLKAVLPNLRRLNLKDCDFMELDCTGLPSLEELELENCLCLRSLSFLPRTLQRLDLRFCGSLQSLKGALPNLRSLNLRECVKLREFNCGDDLDSSLETFFSLPTALEYLDLNNCWGLENLKASLPKISELDASMCMELRRLELDAISVRSLYLSHCKKLEELDCRGIPTLEELELENCLCLRSLSFLPTTLQRLDLRFCGSLESLKASLPNISKLDASMCIELRRLELDAISLRRLFVLLCTKLEELDCRGLPSLKQLDLEGCLGVRSLSSLPTTLESLKASLANISEIDLSNCSELKRLDLEGCLRLRSLSSLPTTLQSLKAFLPNISVLDLSNCVELKKLDLDASCIRGLCLSNCKSLEALDCKGLPSLEELDLQGCLRLRSLLSLPTTLQGLKASLPNIPVLDLSNCIELKRLDLEGCLHLRSLSFLPTTLQTLKASLLNISILDLSNCIELKRLDLEGCRCLKSLSSLPPTLQSLKVSLPNISVLDLSNCIELKRLALEGCLRLRSLSSLPKSLQSLKASLPNIYVLDLSNCIELKRLDLDGCLRLRSLSSLPRTLQSLKASLPNISVLDLSNCIQLKTLDLQGCLRLRNLSCLPRTLQSLKASLPNISVLDLSNCVALKRLDLDASCIRGLCLSNCKNLEAFDCRGVPNLESLDLSRCGKLGVVEGMNTLSRLFMLDIRDCPYLLERQSEITKSLPSVMCVLTV